MPLKIPSAYKTKSGRLRPAKFISFCDFAVPLPSTLFKSPPTSSAFFTIYKSTKTNLEYHAYCENINRYVTDCFAVYMGHTASCGVRVPVDVTKQYARSPACANMNVFKVVNHMLRSSSIGEQLLRQLATTVIREIPFCSIKFPLWEFLYVSVENHKAKSHKHIEWYESAICGSFAGGTAAAITTPIDLAFKSIKVDNVSI
jgi:solute carrier family 25 S-adenosylmethionine transporter 26